MGVLLLYQFYVIQNKRRLANVGLNIPLTKSNFWLKLGREIGASRKLNPTYFGVIFISLSVNGISIEQMKFNDFKNGRETWEAKFREYQGVLLIVIYSILLDLSMCFSSLIF